MKVELINPFVVAAIHVLGQITETDMEKKKLRLMSSPITAHEVNTIIGLTGDVKGQVLLGMSQKTAKAFASKMLMGREVEEFDEIAKSTVNELTNMITGNAVAALGSLGFNCMPSLPTMFVGKDLVVSAQDTAFLVVPIVTTFGEVNLCIVLREKEPK